MLWDRNKQSHVCKEKWVVQCRGFVRHPGSGIQEALGSHRKKKKNLE